MRTKSWSLWIALFAGWISESSGDELRMARFDVQRVFGEYEHSKDATHDAQVRMNNSVRPPSAEWDFLEMRRRYDALVEQVKATQAKLDASKSVGPECAALEKELNSALLAATKSQLDIQEFREKREKRLVEESKKLRLEILREIMAGVKQLGTNRNFQIIFPEKLPEEIAPLWIFPTDRAEDVTDELLKLLNNQYAAKKSPQRK